MSELILNNLYWNYAAKNIFDCAYFKPVTGREIKREREREIKIERERERERKRVL